MNPKSESTLGANPFTEDYFLRGTSTGKSNYENYHWMPELTVPAALRISDHLGMQIGDSILDFGCARGYYVRAFRGLGFDAWGTDISEWAIENCDPIVADAVSLKWPVDRFDWLLMKDVAEHLPHPLLVETTDRLLRSVRRGGLVIVPLAGLNGEYVSPRDRLDPTHCIRWNISEWLLFFQRAIEKSREMFTVSASYRLPGIKQLFDGQEQACGFLTLRARRP